MKTTARKTSLVLLLGAMLIALGACNTMKGAGKDTEKAGEAIQRESTKHGAE